MPTMPGRALGVALATVALASATIAQEGPAAPTLEPLPEATATTRLSPVWSGDGAFVFRETYATASGTIVETEFTLDRDNLERTLSLVPVGPYTLTLISAPPTAELTGIGCEGVDPVAGTTWDDYQPDPSPGDADVWPLAPGGSLTCVLQAQPLPEATATYASQITPALEAELATVQAAVLTDRGDVETAFTLELAGAPVTVRPGELATDDAARADLYRIALLPERGFRLRDIVCLDGAGERLPAEITFENQSIAFAPGIGGLATCTFSLEAELATVPAPSRDGERGLPREGRWRARSGRGSIECGGFSQPIPPGDPGVGTITVRRGGERLILRDLTAGTSRPVRVDRVAGNPDRWVGTQTLTIQGVRATFTFTLDLKSPARIDGRAAAKIRLEGQRCSVERPFVLTYRR